MYSKKYKFLFVHPQKCAGGSIKRSLRRSFKKKNIIETERGGHWSLDQWNYYIDDNLDDYFKFSIVRNPWDRFVSYYFHLKKYRDLKESFCMFLRNFSEEKHRFNVKHKITSQNNIELDFIMKFEDLEPDFDFVMKKLGLEKYTALKKIDHGTSRGKRNYESFYNEVTKNIVAKMCKWEIGEFGYEF